MRIKFTAFQWLFLGSLFVGVLSFVGGTLFIGYAHSFIRPTAARTAEYVVRQLEVGAKNADDLQGSLDQYTQLTRAANVFPASLWILNAKGEIIATNAEADLPPNLKALKPSPRIYETEVRISRKGLHGTTRFRKFPTLHLAWQHQLFASALGKGMIATGVLGLISLLGGTLFLSGGIVIYTRRKAAQVRAVLQQVRAGNLSARFTLNRFDKAGELMNHFNSMLESIQSNLKEKQKQEEERRKTFQQLSHDLRTPLTGISTALQTFTAHAENLDGCDQEKLMEAMTREVDILSLMMDDLFLVSNASNPKFEAVVEPVDLVSVVQTEIQRRKDVGRAPTLWLFDAPSETHLIKADQSLLMRLTQNCLENMQRHCHGKVWVRVERELNGDLCLGIRDNGKGFTQQGLVQFGKETKITDHRRLLGVMGRSFGIGSIVISTICSAHGWALELSNWSEGGESGGQLRIHLGKEIREQADLAA